MKFESAFSTSFTQSTSNNRIMQCFEANKTAKKKKTVFISMTKEYLTNIAQLYTINYDFF